MPASGQLIWECVEAGDAVYQNRGTFQGGGSPDQRVELNSGAQAWPVFSTLKWTWFLEAGHNLPSLLPVLWPLRGGDLKAWHVF